jgi:hypothetical protein
MKWFYQPFVNPSTQLCMAPKHLLEVHEFKKGRQIIQSDFIIVE